MHWFSVHRLPVLLCFDRLMWNWKDRSKAIDCVVILKFEFVFSLFFIIIIIITIRFLFLP